MQAFKKLVKAAPPLEQSKKRALVFGALLALATAIFLFTTVFEAANGGFRFRRSRGKTGKAAKMTAGRKKRRVRKNAPQSVRLPKGGRFFRL